MSLRDDLHSFCITAENIEDVAERILETYRLVAYHYAVHIRAEFITLNDPEQIRKWTEVMDYLQEKIMEV